LLDATCVEHAILTLSSKGYIIREVRVANTEDLRLYRLKKFRDKLLKGGKR
jgi:ribosomal protein S18 acetylase RimI-like enzyme